MYLKKVVLTCAQPTGKLHLGNYLGAIKHWIHYLNNSECYFGIVDLHAITIPYIPKLLHQNTIDCLALYIACGLDPEKSNFFIQSHITGHTELAWLLSSLTPLGILERMTQFKKKAKEKKTAFAGLLNYPILMAADILLYNADIVPVGEDQRQHIEFTRYLASKFNKFYSETFILPKPHYSKDAARVMSLQNPLKKMSKSELTSSGILYLTDKPDILRRKIMRAVTDSGSEILTVKNGINNLLSILSAITGESILTLKERFVGKNTYAALKETVAEAVIAMLSPIRKRYTEIKDDKSYLLNTLAKGYTATQERAWSTITKVRDKIGFFPYFKH